MTIYVIGSGIMGLSVAEYFSRNSNKVTIISNVHPLAGSYAAAANLATKGQRLGRDPHFQMKLDAKIIYSTWIQNLIAECPLYKLEDIFKMGEGIDIFANTTDRDTHLKRVLQNKDELLSVYKQNSIVYQNEAWVDAPSLLTLLQSVLKKRGVNFIQEDFSCDLYQKILDDCEQNVILFCTGAWTKQLLINLQLPLPSGFKKQERLTVGSTFVSQNSFTQKFVLYEKISEGLKQKVTFSGNNSHQCISSSSLKINSCSGLESEYTIALNEKNKDLIQFAQAEMNLEGELVEKCGLRVGYGHAEILIESIVTASENTKAMVCCGAHKSGYLFAPVMGQYLEKLIH